MTCPTGSAATMLDEGQTFHHVFYVKDNDSKSDNAIASILRKANFSDDVDLIIVDEVSMISAEYLVLLDSRLRLLYDSSLPFGGKHVLLSRDYLQMPSTFGTHLCTSLYLTTDTNKTNTRQLFSLFSVFHINDQVRATCEKQKRCLEKFRKLPNFYPSSTEWRKKEKDNFSIIDDEIMETLTKEISQDDIANNSKWKSAPIVTNNNFDRLRLNHELVTQFARENNALVVKWRKLVTTKNILIAALNAIYDQHLELIGYFVKGTPIMVTSNQSGSFDLKIVNGTKCILEALYWKDSSIQ